MNPTPTRTVSVTANAPGAAVSKYLVCLNMADGSPNTALRMAEEHCRRTPIVEHSLRAFVTKGAVGAATMAQTGWASETAPYGIGAEAYMLLQSASIFGRLNPAFRRLPFRVKVSKETGAGGSGAWKGEGLPRIVAKSTFETLTQEYASASVIVAATKELFRFGAVAEAALRAMVIAAVTRWVDGQLLNPTVAATSAHPASLTYGAHSVTQSGTTAAAMITDLKAMIAAILSPGDSLFWIGQPLSFAYIHATLAGAGYPTERGYLFGIPIIAASSSPHQIALIDASNVAFSSDDTLALDISTEATVEMSDAPGQSGVSGAGAQMVSFYQSGLVGVRADLAATWQHIHYGNSSPTVAAGASYMTVTY